MRFVSFKKSTTLAAVVIGFFHFYIPLLSHVYAEPRLTYSLGSGTPGGTYYPVGEGFSSIVRVYLTPKTQICLDSVKTAGSGENLLKLQNNEVQFALMQSLVTYNAWNGTDQTESAHNLRSITAVWPNIEHYVIASSSAKTETIDDLLAMQGEKMAMGKKNSGAIGSNSVILKNFGLDIAKAYQLKEYSGYTESGNAFEKGEVSGFGIPAGAPAKVITDTFAKMGNKAVLLSFSEEQAKKADGGLHIWIPYTIKKGTYPNIDHDVQTIAQKNIFVVRSDVDEEVVYQITKTLFQHLRHLNIVHKATKEMGENKALEGLPIPLHPGAARYFKEIGITIPQELLPPKKV